MADDAVFAGAALRRLRRKEGMTQAAMAERIGISPSYLNLIERNQRPLTARVMMQVVDRFDFDPRGFREDESIGGVAGLVRRFQDERFADLGIDRDDHARLDGLVGARLVLAAFVASLGLVIGALGASFEEEHYIRHIAFVDEET